MIQVVDPFKNFILALMKVIFLASINESDIFGVEN